MADPPVTRIETGPDQGFEIALAADPKPILGKTRAPVWVEVNGYRYRSTVAAMNGGWFVPFRKSHRDAAALNPAQTYAVALTLDTDLRTVEPSEDLIAAINAAGRADDWARLSYTQQCEHAEAIESAKRPDTRTRRIATCVARLAGD